jgi:hypothetical protein
MKKFKTGFIQKSKKGNYFIKVIKLGTEKIAIRWLPEIKIEKPTLPIFDKKDKVRK